MVKWLWFLSGRCLCIEGFYSFFYRKKMMTRWFLLCSVFVYLTCCSRETEDRQGYIIDVTNSTSNEITIGQKGNAFSIQPYASSRLEITEDDMLTDGSYDFVVNGKVENFHLDTSKLKLVFYGGKLSEINLDSEEDYSIFLSEGMYSLMNEYQMNGNCSSKGFELVLSYMSDYIEQYYPDVVRTDPALVYQLMPYVTKIIIDGEIHDFWADRSLPNEDCLHYLKTLLLYNDMRDVNQMAHQEYAMLKQFYDDEVLPQDVSISTYNITSISKYLIDSLPKGEMRSHFILSLLTEEVTAPRKYENKEELMNKLANELSGNKLTIARQLLKEHIVDGKNKIDGSLYVEKLKRIDFQDCNKDTVKLPFEEDADFLVKYWFDGCKACEYEKPYEEELLLKYDKLKIVYINYKTDWNIFEQNCQSTTNARIEYYKLPIENEIEILQDLNKKIGAPIYAYYSAAKKKFECIECPKPSDKELRKYMD